MQWDGEKLATRGLALLIAYAAVTSVFRAASKPFEYDELCTVAIARQPGISAIWKALERRRGFTASDLLFCRTFC